MSEEKKASTEVSKVEAEGGRIVFADEVVATIAALAVSDVEGVSAVSGGMVEGITEMLGKKNLTKGVKVEVGQEEAAVDISVSIKYGYKIKEVCEKIQESVKSAIENMTGLRVVEINVFVQSVVFEPAEQETSRAAKRKEKEKAKETKEKEAPPVAAELVEPEPPRVK
ncbi:MAG: Asp23/Gls24 family envelope stress response protein [Clostridiales bacterium]|nr:Asp23/Gls24 family envelope stress response protein [Clostridiales bacterium]